MKIPNSKHLCFRPWLVISTTTLAILPSAMAAVTLTFEADLQGFQFANFGGTNNNSSVTWDANGGNGRMKVTNTNTVSNFAWIVKYFTNAGQTGIKLAVYNELTLAMVNGGTISYDVTYQTADGFTGGTPSFRQTNFMADNQNGSFDQEFNAPGSITIPSTVTYSMTIQTTGTKVNDDDKVYLLGGTGNLQFGFGSSYSNNTSTTSVTYYVDNFKITAVPEPSAWLIAGLGGVFLLRRRR